MYLSCVPLECTSHLASTWTDLKGLSNPFRSVQVEEITLSDLSKSRPSLFLFLGAAARHSDFPGYERDVTRIALPDSSPDTQPSNSCSELAAIWASHLAALQPAYTTASQQIRHTRAHVLILLECLHTTPILILIFNFF